MKRLLIVGAGAFGREVADWATAAAAAGADFQPVAFLDNIAPPPDFYGGRLPYWGAPAEFSFGPADVVVCALGDPRVRLRYCRELAARNVAFSTVIHPSAVIGRDVRLGAGTIICPQAVVTNNATIGRFCIVNVCATVAHDAVLGEGCTLCDHVDITGRVVLGEGVFVGSHATVLPGVEVGAYATIGAGAAVLKPVAAGSTVFGVPARPICSGEKTSVSKEEQRQA